MLLMEASYTFFARVNIQYYGFPSLSLSSLVSFSILSREGTKQASYIQKATQLKYSETQNNAR